RARWICSAYLGDAPGSALTPDGWFPTGDMAVLHPDGSMQSTDRKKDLIKSGGEWISSIDLEEAAARHPEIALAAVIGVADEKWGERPLLIAQPAPGASPTKESVLEFLEGQVSKIWLPDDVVFVDALPLGPTGKVQKMQLREKYGRQRPGAGSGIYAPHATATRRLPAPPRLGPCRRPDRCSAQGEAGRQPGRRPQAALAARGGRVHRVR